MNTESLNTPYYILIPGTICKGSWTLYRLLNHYTANAWFLPSWRDSSAWYYRMTLNATSKLPLCYVWYKVCYTIDSYHGYTYMYVVVVYNGSCNYRAWLTIYIIMFLGDQSENSNYMAGHHSLSSVHETQNHLTWWCNNKIVPFVASYHDLLYVHIDIIHDQLLSIIIMVCNTWSNRGVIYRHRPCAWWPACR